MGMLDKLEEAAAAVAAVEGLKKIDPNASTLEEAAAAVAAFKGAEMLKEKLAEKTAQEEEGEGGAAAPAA